MNGRARFIFPVLMSGQMVLMVTALVTVLNIGFASNFFLQWIKAFAISWPVAASAAFFAIPVARRATDLIVGVIGN